MARKKKNYYLAYVLFDNGHKCVLALETYSTDEELVRLYFESWSRGFTGMNLEILTFSSCGLNDYRKTTTKISW
jgi:hypothetical protein